MRWRIYHKVKGHKDVPEWTTDVDQPEFDSIEAVKEWFAGFEHLKFIRAENLDLPVTVAPLHDEDELRAMNAAAEVHSKKKR
jgi:hypothetical protein